MRLNATCLCTCALTLVLVCAYTSAVPQKNPARPLDVGDSASRQSLATREGKRYGSSVRNDVRRQNTAVTSSMQVSDGHRLITRALWRIFDALMQKKDHSQLYSRLAFVEEALKKMISVDSQLEDEIDKLKDDNVICKAQLSTILEEISNMKSINARLTQLEEAQSTPPLPQGDQQQDEWAATAYSSCPEPFEKVSGECFYLSNEEMLSWDDARKECGRLGGDLASPRNLNGLRSYLKSVEAPPEYLWAGGSLDSDKTWVWSTGSMAGVPVDMSKDTWNEEVPSGPGKCMGFFRQSSYRAYNYQCLEKDFFVCQYFF